MQNNIEPTYYIDPNYSSSEITMIFVPSSGSMGGSCSSGLLRLYLRIELGPDADTFEAALAECTTREQEEDTHRRRDEEISALLYEQALATAREFDAKQAGWRREAEEQDKMYIDLVSDDDE